MDTVYVSLACVREVLRGNYRYVMLSRARDEHGALFGMQDWRRNYR